MFYTGDLQSGISLAVSQSKLVGCFVHDDSETSKTWEDEYLTNANLPALFEEKVVLLRLEKGSQGAGFLAQMYPIPHFPTLVLIGAGQLKAYVSSNSTKTKEDFTTRVQAALESYEVQTSTSTSPQPSTSTPQPPATSQPPPPTSSTPQPTSSTPQPQASSSTPRPTPTSTQQILSERAQRLANDKAAKEASAKAASTQAASAAKAEKDAYEAGKPIDPAKKANLEYAKQRTERLKKEKDDLAKVRKRVEDDKIERKARAERERALRRGEGEVRDVGEKSSFKPSNTEKSCAIQIRLFDGSTIRKGFPPTSTLHTDIRPWIQTHLKSTQTPSPEYTFKLVQTPLPNRNISISEENMELRELGLVPSATLILVPVQGQMAGAYEGGRGGLFGLVGSGIGMVAGAVGSVLGAVLPGGGAAAPAQEVREERREDREFYNGNNLSFEPRRDEDE